jgi:hypothetical protein
VGENPRPEGHRATDVRVDHDDERREQKDDPDNQHDDQRWSDAEHEL